MPPEADSIEAIVQKAVENASTQKAAAAVADETPKIVEKAVSEAMAQTRTVMTEVAKNLEDRYEKMAEAAIKKAVEESARAAAATRSAFGLIPRAEEEPLDKPLLAARIVRAWLFSNRNMEKVPGVLLDQYQDRAGSEYLQRALETSKPSSGGVLIMPEVLVSEFIPNLREESTLMGDVRKVPMPSGALRIPGFQRGVNMGWTGEKNKNRAQTPGFRAMALSSKMAYAIVCITKSLLEEASIQADQLVMADIVAALAELLDDTFYNAEATKNSPGGMLVHPDIHKTPLNAEVDADLPAAIVATVMSRKVQFSPQNAGWRFNPQVWAAFYNLKSGLGVYHFREEMNQGRLLGYPFKITTLIANGSDENQKSKLVFGKFSEWFVGETRDLTFELSDQASYYDETGELRSSFAEDSYLVKATYKCDAEPRQPEALEIVTDIHTVASP